MRSGRLLVSLLIAASVLAHSSVHAGIVSVSPTITQIAAPVSANSNSGLESNTTTYLFSEQQNVTLTQAAQVNATTAGFFSAIADLTPGSIPIGTLVSSYYVHADNVGSGGIIFRYGGTITFDTDILGISVLTSELLSTSFLGAPGTTYTSLAGIELGGGTYDSLTISADRRTLSFDFEVWAAADAMRVITAGNAVPEPGTLSLMFAAALGALALRRRKHVS